MVVKKISYIPNKCLDWTIRNIQFIESVPENIIEEVQSKIEPLIF